MNFTVNIGSSKLLLTLFQTGELQARITEEEIKQVIFRMKPGKAPGPNGFTMGFLKKSWDIVIEALKFCFDHECMYYSLKCTTTTLVSKVPNAM